VVRRDAPANWILVWPEAPHHGLIDYDHRRRAVSIGVSKVTAFGQWNSQSGEIARTDNVESNAGLPGGRVWNPFNAEANAVFVLSERNICHYGRGLDIGQTYDSVQYLAEQSGSRRGMRVFGGREREIDRHHILRAYA